MACTVFLHRHLRLDAVAFALPREWPFLQLQVTLAKTRPFHPTSLRPLYFHHSCLWCSPRVTLVTFADQPPLPVFVLVAPRRLMMMMRMMMIMMSPLCLSLVLIVFFKNMCMSSVLACCTSVWSHYKKHVKKGLDKTKALWEEGCGTCADGNQCFGPFLSQFLM